MNRVFSTIRSYILWTHERGSLHYDVMVTLILAFIFLGPRFVDFKDKPAARNPHPTEVVVSPDGSGGFVYELDLPNRRTDEHVHTRLQRAIEPMSGEVEILRWDVTEQKVATTKYRVWVRRR